MANPIVIVNVTQTIAPSPSTLQKTGALISQGGTTLTAGTYSLLTQLSDLTPLLATPLVITGAVYAGAYGGQVTTTTTVAHGVTVGEQFITTVAGAVPTGYNGTYVATATGTSTFTYRVSSALAACTTPGTYTPRGSGELLAMATTFFTQGAQQAVYVLELGAGEAAAGVTTLTSFITASEQFFYSYLVPRTWASESTFLTMLATYESTTAKTYFFVSANLENYTGFTSLMKCAVVLVEAPVYRVHAAATVSAAAWSGGLVTVTTAAAHGIYPGDTFTLTGALPAAYNGTYIAQPGTVSSTLIYALATNPTSYTSGGTVPASLYASAGVPATEFTHASDYWVALNYDPSTTNRVPPFAFSFLFGVTRFPTLGNSALLTTLKTASVSYVGFGGEGGISDNILLYGHTMDGNPFNYWYSVDWAQINVDLAISNAIINGSNNPINPLYYNQDGINRLEQVAAGVGGSAVSFGLALGRVISVGLDGTTFQANLNAGLYRGNLVVNAIPFTSYTATNPSDYPIGKYAGLSMTYTPLRGFEQIIFNINVTNFVA